MIQINAARGNKVLADPRRMLTPSSKHTIPRYIGFRLKRKKSVVTRDVACVKGINPVFALMNMAAECSRSARPGIVKSNPAQLNGLGISVASGHQRCRQYMAISAKKSQAGGYTLGFVIDSAMLHDR